MNDKTKQSIEDVIKTRRSIRKYKKDPINLTDLLEILQLATWAPSAHNAKPYYFLIVESDDVKVDLIKRMGEKYGKDLKNDGISGTIRRNIIDESFKRFTSSPLLIIPCLSMERMHEYPDEKRNEAEYTMAIQSVSAAIQNLLLASHSRGLGCCWHCAPLFCQEVVREVLKIPDSFDPQAIITVGHPDEMPSPPPRIEIKKITFKNKWGQVF